MTVPSFRSLLSLLSLPGFAGAAIPIPEEYTLTAISEWVPAELPWFDRFVHEQPAGTTPDFTPVARNGSGLVAGTRRFASGTWVQNTGAFVVDGSQTDIPAWLREGSTWSYSWSWTYWDGDDFHFQNGFVTHSPVLDVNLAGQVVGFATVPGAGNGAGSSSAYDDHAWLRDTVTGTHLDLTPDAHRASPNGINDLGQIVGTWSGDSGHHPFLREPDGTFLEFTLDVPTAHVLTPVALNNRRLVAGDAIVYTTPMRDQRPWVCESGTAISRLPLPSQNSPDVGTIADVNDHGVIVGEAHKAAAFTETNAVRWTSAGGSWVAEDLNELVDDNRDFLLDAAIAVNDAGHIVASGHLDGTDTRNTHRLVLTPSVLPPPTATTLSAVEVSATAATLRAALNAAGLDTNARFEHGATTAYGSQEPLATLSGTRSLLAEVRLEGLAPGSNHHFRIVAENASGTTEGDDAMVTTPWDWPSWAAAHLDTSDPHGDADGNGRPDLLDYATGAGPGSESLSAGDGDRPAFTFRRSLVADGVILIVQVSDDLVHWRDGSQYALAGDSPADGVTPGLSRVPDGPEGEWITVVLDGDGSPTARFVRLVARMPP